MNKTNQLSISRFSSLYDVWQYNVLLFRVLFAISWEVKRTDQQLLPQLFGLYEAPLGTNTRKAGQRSQIFLI